MFKTKDGFINIAANKQEQWESVADVLGVSELKTDARFRERDARKKNRKELTPLLNAKLAQKETAVWVDELNKHDVPAGAILTLDGALKQEQVIHLNVFVKVAVDGIGELELFNLSAKFSKTPGIVETPPPTLGQHTNDILAGIGYSKEEIQKFKEMKAI